MAFTTEFVSQGPYCWMGVADKLQIELYFLFPFVMFMMKGRHDNH